MKRRTFLKGMAGILSSVMAGRSLASSEKAIPDPVRERFAEVHTVYPETLGITHLDDALRYDALRFMDGEQWSSVTIRQMADRQKRLNKARSLVINKINLGRIKIS